MKYFLGLIIIANLLSSCGQKTSEVETQTSDTVKQSIAETTIGTTDIFADSNFTFVLIDSLSEDMLFNKTEKGKVKFIESRKSFKKEHCEFFKTGCTNSFWDDYTFLVSKQSPIGEILPVIIHDSKDFDYYHSELFTLDKELNKIDSILVSLVGYDRDGEDDYSTTREIRSRFSKDKIITTEFKIKKFDNDSTVTMDSVITHRKIEKNGHITVEKQEKII
jgi:hypothetical protein